ncbi:MAG TPA: hypothetical protein VJ952_13005 [Opitutales bacterium]|nr:hypothetical protein [Opitutales bacterium]
MTDRKDNKSTAKGFRFIYRIVQIICLGLAWLWIGNSSLTADTLGVRSLGFGADNKTMKPYLEVGGRYHLLAFPQSQPDRITYVNHDVTMPLYDKTVNSDGTHSYKIIETVKLPEDARSILLLRLDAKSAGKYLVIDDMFLEADYSDWLMINTTSKPIDIEVAEENYRIKPKSNKICKTGTPAGEAASITGLVKWEDQLRKFYSTYWPVRKGERSIVIFSEQGNRIRIKRIADALPSDP